jgi:hypothetical protein
LQKYYIGATFEAALKTDPENRSFQPLEYTISPQIITKTVEKPLTSLQDPKISG